MEVDDSPGVAEPESESTHFAVAARLPLTCPLRLVQTAENPIGSIKRQSEVQFLIGLILLIPAWKPEAVFFKTQISRRC
jgi:hypothetical protein